MNIQDKLRDNPDDIRLYISARAVNLEEVDRIVNCYQASWDAGDKFDFSDQDIFTAIGMFGDEKREADTDAEREACLNGVRKDLRRILCEGWLKSMPRAEMEILCNILHKIPSMLGQVDLIPGISFASDTLKPAWEHVNQQQRGCRSLKEARAAAGMSQKQLAEASGVNIRQIQRVENGEGKVENLTAKNFLAIVDALGIYPHELI